jgi:hypothetical protein
MLKDVLRQQPRDLADAGLHGGAGSGRGPAGVPARRGPGLRVRFGCAWLKARTLSPVAARFMELLTELRPQPGDPGGPCALRGCEFYNKYGLPQRRKAIIRYRL